MKPRGSLKTSPLVSLQAAKSAMPGSPLVVRITTNRALWVVRLTTGATNTPPMARPLKQPTHLSGASANA